MKPYLQHIFVPFIVILIFFSLPGASWFNDPGTFFHTAVGERILSERSFPTVDTFTFPHAGKPWIAQQWLGEIVMALIYHVAGWDGLFLVGLLLISTLFLVLWVKLITAGLHVLTALFIFILVVSCSSHHFLLRPHLLTIVFLSCQHLMLRQIERGEKTTTHLFLLVPLYIIWANCHGGVLGGFASLLVTGISWTLAYLFFVPTGIRSRSDLWQFLLLSLATVGCFFLNPYGRALMATWRTIMTAPTVGTAIIEHLPLLQVWYGWPAVALGLMYAATLAGIPRNKLLGTPLLPIVWFLLAYGRVRHAPLFALLAGLSLAELVPSSCTWRFFATRVSAFFALQPPEFQSSVRAIAGTVLVILAVGTGAQALGFPVPVIGKGIARFSPAHWPIGVTSAVQAYAKENPPGTPIFNEMLFGGWLTFHAPSLRVFIDDRCELLGEEGLREYLDGLANPDKFKVWEDRYGFSAALTSPGSPFDSHLRNRPDWTLQAESPGGNWYRKIAEP